MTETAAVPAPHRLTTLTANDLTLIVGCFVVSRLLLTVFGLVTLNSYAGPAPDMIGAASYAATLPDLFVRWDSLWYLSIAQHGYTMATPPLQEPGSTSYAFYPLYPLAMWLLSSATGLSLAVAGLVVSNVSFLAALVFVFLLAERWSGDKTVAAFTVALLCFVPEGFIFSAVYTESLFLLLTAASMWAFERKQNVLAGFLAALGSLSRSNGVLIVVYFGFAILRERGLKDSLRFWQQPERYLPIVLAPLGLFAFWWFCMLTTGDAFAQKSSMIHGWSWHVAAPWTNIIAELFGAEGRSQFLMGSSLVAFLLSLTLLRRRDSWPLFGYCAANFALFWTGSLANSLLRYAIVLFPIFFGMSRAVAHRPILAAASLLVFALLDVLLMGLWAVGSGLIL